MILANEQVAELLARRKLPALYRVHRAPEPESIEALVKRFADLGVPTAPVPKHLSESDTAAWVSAQARVLGKYIRGRERRGRGVLVAAPALARPGALPRPRTSGTPVSRRRRTATSPRRSGAIPTSSATAACSRRSGRTRSLPAGRQRARRARRARVVDRARGGRHRAARRRHLRREPARRRAARRPRARARRRDHRADRRRAVRALLGRRSRASCRAAGSTPAIASSRTSSAPRSSARATASASGSATRSTSS